MKVYTLVHQLFTQQSMVGPQKAAYTAVDQSWSLCLKQAAFYYYHNGKIKQKGTPRDLFSVTLTMNSTVIECVSSHFLSSVFSLKY